MHIWLRSEANPNESRTPLLPAGARLLLRAGFRVTVERTRHRVASIGAYRNAGCDIAASGDWRRAPADAVILGLRDLPGDGTPLAHTHIMFGHGVMGQSKAQCLHDRFNAGGGTFLDLDLLKTRNGRGLVSSGHWAGFTGAALALIDWADMHNGHTRRRLSAWPNQDSVIAETRWALDSVPTPRVLISGAAGHAGTGAAALCAALSLDTLCWRRNDTARPDLPATVMQRDILVNCIKPDHETPALLTPSMVAVSDRALRVVCDVACCPDHPTNPIRIYDRPTGWDVPVRRLAIAPPLDLIAVGNLPALLPREASEDLAEQLLPLLLQLRRGGPSVWDKARTCPADQHSDHGAAAGASTG